MQTGKGWRLPIAVLLLAVLVGVLAPDVFADDATTAASGNQGESHHEPGDESGAGQVDLLVLFYIFVLASFLGHQLITRVPPLLHTPLMSGTNAISGISLVGSLVAAGLADPFLCNLLGGIAVGCAMCNVVGGFAITDRMLAKFRKGSR